MFRIGFLAGWIGRLLVQMETRILCNLPFWLGVLWLVARVRKKKCDTIKLLLER